VLARLLQLVTLSLLGAAILWLAVFRELSPVLAWGGALLILFGHSVFLALEYVALHFINRADPAPPASVGDLVRAWWVETFMALLVFCWRQPFLSNRVPDHCLPQSAQQGRRGVVFIHGFMCNRGLWTPWLRQLRAEGRAFVAVNLEPVFGSIDDYVPLVDAAVARVTAATGLPPVLVCHSMGGLAARAWLRARDADARVRHIVTIGTPHHGTWPARFSHVANGRQMRQGGLWLRQLAQDEPPQRAARFTCWYSSCDNIVFPASTATLRGALNHHVAGVAHMALAVSPAVMVQTLDSLRRDAWPVAA
jgi:triacylglycerol esterase/lipase EstA (alpha/beta hydrolase family)